MTKALLQAYKIEYETTDISMAHLCDKYNIAICELSGCESWTKSIENHKTSRDIVKEQKATPPAEQQPIPLANSKEQVLDNIEEFKQLAIKHAVRFIKEESQYADVKEFKDMVSIVDSIEKSYNSNKETGTTVNIAIQNLVNRYKDDCLIKSSKKLDKLKKDYLAQKVELSKEQQEFIDTKLSSKLWRMDSLYTIRDKNSIKMIMRLNPSQKKILTQV